MSHLFPRVRALMFGPGALHPPQLGVSWARPCQAEPLGPGAPMHPPPQIRTSAGATLRNQTGVKNTFAKRQETLLNYLFFLVEKLRSQSSQVRRRRRARGERPGAPALRKARAGEHPAVGLPASPAGTHRLSPLDAGDSRRECWGFKASGCLKGGDWKRR